MPTRARNWAITSFACGRTAFAYHGLSISVNLAPGYDLSSLYETRICPSSVVGHRNAKLVKKSANIAIVYLMESSGQEM